MPWLKIDHATPEKPEVIAIAARLDMSPDEVFGVLFRMWRWFDVHTQTGNARSVTGALLNRLLGVSGFAEAVIEVGWLLQTEAGLQIPNFERHNGQTSKARALTASRVQSHRANKGQNCNGDVTDDVTPQALPREEKEKNIGGVPPITPRRGRGRRKSAVAADILDGLVIPIELGAHDAQQAVADWLDHKDRIGDQYASSKSFQTELQRWAKLGAARFIAAVTYSVGKEWRGIYEEDVRHGPTTRAGPTGGPCDPAEQAKRNREERQAFLKKALEVDE